MSRRDAHLEGGLALLGDGDAEVEEAERLRAPEGREIGLNLRFLIKAVGWSVERLVSWTYSNLRLVRFERVEGTTPERGLLLR